MWISRLTSKKSTTWRSKNRLHKHCIQTGRVWDKKSTVDKTRVFPHLILWIYRQLSTAASQKIGFDAVLAIFYYFLLCRPLKWHPDGGRPGVGQAVFFEQLAITDSVGVFSKSSCKTLFGAVFDFFFENPRFSRFCRRFIIDLYKKIVVIVNAEISVDKSFFFNRISHLQQK